MLISQWVVPGLYQAKHFCGDSMRVLLRMYLPRIVDLSKNAIIIPICH